MKGTGFERKNKVRFFIAFWQSSFKMSYFQNNFLHAMAVLGYLPKLKRGLGLAFGTHFPHVFSVEVSLFNTLSMDKVPMPFLFSFSRYQTNSYLDSWWSRKLSDLSSSNL